MQYPKPKAWGVVILLPLECQLSTIKQISTGEEWQNNIEIILPEFKSFRQKYIGLLIYRSTLTQHQQSIYSQPTILQVLISTYQNLEPSSSGDRPGTVPSSYNLLSPTILFINCFAFIFLLLLWWIAGDNTKMCDSLATTDVGNCGSQLRPQPLPSTR